MPTLCPALIPHPTNYRQITLLESSAPFPVSRLSCSSLFLDSRSHRETHFRISGRAFSRRLFSLFLSLSHVLSHSPPRIQRTVQFLRSNLSLLIFILLFSPSHPSWRLRSPYRYYPTIVFCPTCLECVVISLQYSTAIESLPLTWKILLQRVQILSPGKGLVLKSGRRTT